MSSVTAQDLVIRVAEPADDATALPMLRASLGKVDDPHYEAFLRWKHRDNPFGVSPAWVALHDGVVVGYRTFLRWEFLTDAGRTLRAVRAVDTATDPAYRGLGIFRTLTLQGVSELTLAGDGIVFNTPNDQSRPGYLKMGWSLARQLPVGVMPRGPRSLVSMVTSRVPASLWSEETDVGLDAAVALADRSVAEQLIAHAPSAGVRTHRTPDYLAWRTAFGPLRYRLLLADDADPSRGGVVFRLRRRGDAVEAAIVEQLAPDRRTGAWLVRRVLRETGADYAIGLRTGPSAGLVPLPRQGPLLTTRPLAASPPAPGDWALTLGDVELF
ncbi:MULTISPECIES: GNAT family N-acetyltransferase [unclassified Knoellia]|uniref:GNAT family N-acetyltransferase n=1 Tax=Knoellia altitudinis TaxID=3404795 RepID=UPI00361F7A77